MTEKERWDLGVCAVRKEYAGLSPADRSHVKVCVGQIRSLKNELQLIAEGADAGAVCALCSGECCRGGKGHVRAVDLIAYLSDGREIFTPCFEKAICPYLGDGGCLMEPGYRPFNCITFICERVEDLLGAPEKERYYELERRLRILCGKLEERFDYRFRSSILSMGGLHRPVEERKETDEFPGNKEMC
jgi:hypothetical protein